MLALGFQEKRWLVSSLSFNFLLMVGPPSRVGSWPTFLRVLHIPGGCHQISAISNIQEITSLKLVGSSQLLWISIGYTRLHQPIPSINLWQKKVLLITKTRVLELTLKIYLVNNFWSYLTSSHLPSSSQAWAIRSPPRTADRRKPVQSDWLPIFQLGVSLKWLGFTNKPMGFPTNNDHFSVEIGGSII